MDYLEILIQAASDIENSGIPTDLRPAAFTKLVDLRLATSVPSSNHGIARVDPPETPTAAGSSTVLADIASRVQVSYDSVAEIYHESEGDLGLSVASSKLAPGKAGGTKEIALLVAAGRQASGIDTEWTSASEIRKQSKDYNRFDQGNFAGAITEMADVFSFRGRGPSREVRVSRPGWEAATQLMKRLAGEE